MIIHNARDLCTALGAESEERAKRALYKAIACGPWLAFDPTGVRVGSIVEGCDVDATTRMLPYPFTSHDFDAAVKALDEEAGRLWDWANVRRDKTGRKNCNGKTDAERGCDAPSGD